MRQMAEKLKQEMQKLIITIKGVERPIVVIIPAVLRAGDPFQITNIKITPPEPLPEGYVLEVHNKPI